MFFLTINNNIIIYNIDEIAEAVNNYNFFKFDKRTIDKIYRKLNK